MGNPRDERRLISLGSVTVNTILPLGFHLLLAQAIAGLMISSAFNGYLRLLDICGFTPTQVALPAIRIPWLP